MSFSENLQKLDLSEEVIFSGKLMDKVTANKCESDGHIETLSLTINTFSKVTNIFLQISSKSTN